MSSIEIIIQTTQAIAANPSDAAAYKTRALTLCQMQQYAEAQKDLDTLIDTLRMEQGDKIGALSDMRKALDLNPELLQKLNGEFKNQ